MASKRKQPEPSTVPPTESWSLKRSKTVTYQELQVFALHLDYTQKALKRLSNDELHICPTCEDGDPSVKNADPVPREQQQQGARDVPLPMTNAASPQSASVNQTHVNNVGNGDQDEVNTENLDGVTLIEDTPSEQEPSAIINANLNAMNTSEPSQEQKPEAGLPLQAVSLETRNLSLPPRIERPSADLNLVHPTRRQVLKGNQDLKSLEEQMTQAGYTIDQVEDSFFGYSIHSIMQNRYKLDQPTPCATLLSMELDSPLPNGPQRQLEIVDRILTLRNLRRKLLGRSFESFRFFDPSTPSASHGSLVQVEVDQSLRSFLYDAWSRRDERSAWKRLELQLVPLVKANRAFFPELWKCNFLGG